MKKVNFNKQQFDLDVSGYTPNFQDRSGELIENLIEGTPILSSIPKQTGAKGNTTVQLNILSDEISPTNNECLTSASASTTIAPRDIDVKFIGDRNKICANDLSAKLPHLLRAGAGGDNLGQEFANAWMNNRSNLMAAFTEKLMFQGDTVSGVGELALADGLLAIAGGETADLAYYATYSGLTAGNAISTIEDVIANQASVTYSIEDFTIFVSMPDFKTIQRALIAAYPQLLGGTGVYLNGGSSDQVDRNALYWPGEKNVIVRGTAALNGNGSIIALPYSEIRIATDLESDMEMARVFYDMKEDSYFCDIKFAIGFQYVNPGNVVYIEKV